jgi:uncharacterized iron-regulated membrane protein
MRALVLVLHRYVALVAAVVVLALGLSGAGLVFEGAIDRALNPALWYAGPVGSPVPLDTLAARVAASAGAPVDALSLGKAPGIADVATVGATQVFVNPYTGAVLGTRSIAEWNRTFARRLHVFHTTLSAGRIGGMVVSAVTAAVLFLVLSGLWLWWPDRLWRVRWSASWKRVAFDLHHATGVAAAVFLLAISASGVVMSYRSIAAWIGRLDAVPPPTVPAQPAAVAGALPIGFDSLAAVGRHALPGAIPMVVAPSRGGGDPDVVYMRYPEDHTPAGRSRVFVDRYSGAVLLAVSTRTAQTGTRILNVLRSVHTGDLFGRPTEVLWLLAALALASQALTGAAMWWNARRTRMPRPPVPAADRARARST